MIKIITDSSSDISQEEAKRLGITVMPMTIIFGGEQFKDGVDISTDEFYNKLVSANDFPHTSQLSEVEFEETFKRECESGDDVLVMTITSALSGTHSLAERVAKNCGYKNLHVYDTGATTAILRVLVLEAVANREKSIDEVVAILNDLRPRIKLFAALDTLEYLQKGGRLSQGTALIGTLLKIKPIITHDERSNVKLIGKAIGFHLALKILADKIDVKKIDYTKPVYMIYTMDDVNCNSLATKLKINNYEKLNICPVIGAHIGPKAAGIVYVEKKS
jgi:DegV family protein with EDD domain